MFMLIISTFTGTSFAIWVGSFASPADEVAVLACVAINGNHSLVAYQWARDGSSLSDEVYPVMYATLPGTYSCTVTGEQSGIFCQNYCFHVDSKLHIFAANLCWWNSISICFMQKLVAI